jgi:hypothetical protein
MVFVFDDFNCTFGQQWQYYLRAINYNASIQMCSRMMDDNVAFMNGSGTAGKSRRRNWLKVEDMESKDPETDKTRTCGDARIQMNPIVPTAEILAKLKYREGDKVPTIYRVTFLDGTKPPPLKVGYSYPRSLREISIEAYVYTPATHPAYFTPATTTGSDGKAHSWPNSPTYPWYKSGNTPVAFWPHVAVGPVYYPPKQLTDNTPIVEEI